jgi:carbon monoxide dehydrogenase subunit G
MRIDNEFEVAAPIERVWLFMLDVEKVAPCVPGGKLTEVVDDHTWKGKVSTKMGPVSLSFAGTVTIEERDDANHRVALKAEGREQRGRGAATARSTSTLQATADGGTQVTIGTDLTITGAVAQYGRGMIGDISHRLTGEFASCLEANILAEGGAEPTEGAAPDDRPGPPANPAAPANPSAPARSAAPRSAAPVKGIRLGLWAFWRAMVRFFRRLFGGGRS